MKIFENKAALTAASLKEGQIVTTKGYYTAGDGGGATYLIKTAAAFGGTPDGYGDHTLANFNVAVLQTINDSVVFLQYGIKADGTTPDLLAWQAIFNSGYEINCFDTGSKSQVSGEITGGINTIIRGNGVQIECISTIVERCLVFSNASGLKISGVSFTTTGTVDQFIHMASGSGIELKNNTFDHDGCTALMSSYSGGVYGNGVAEVEIRKNVFKNGWRDLGFDAGNVGGNNLYRSVDISNSGQHNIKFIDNEFNTVFSGAYVSNTNDLFFIRNKVITTADTAFFDRCTGGVTKRKRFIGNTFISIGKAAIKTLDTNNTNDLVWAEDSIIEGNYIENWGMYIASECVLAARNISGSYVRSAIKAQRLKVINNVFRQTTSGDTTGCFKFINVDDVVVSGNTIEPIDSLGDEQLLSQWCSNVSYDNNTWILNGHIRLSYAHEGKYKFTNNTVNCGDNITITDDVLGVTQIFKISDNLITNSNASPATAFGLQVSAVPADFVLNFTGNYISTNIAYTDGNGAGNKNMVGLPFTSAQLINNNIVQFTDQLATQIMLAGDLLYPVYYQGLPGASKNNGVAAITYKGTTSRTADVFTITQT